MNLPTKKFSFQICFDSQSDNARVDIVDFVQCSCFPVKIEPSGGTEGLDEAIPEGIEEATGGCVVDAVVSVTSVGRRGRVEAIGDDEERLEWSIYRKPTQVSI